VRGALSLSAAQVDRRIKAVAPVVMYDHHRLYSAGFRNSLTEEQRNDLLDARAEQRYADSEGAEPVLTPRDAPIGFDENTDRIDRELTGFYSTPRGYHPNSITQFTTTSSLSFMNFPLLSKLEWISPRPILFVTGEHAHSRRRLRARGRAEGALHRPERRPRRPLRQGRPEPVRQA
jgi:hypothetical protein